MRVFFPPLREPRPCFGALDAAARLSRRTRRERYFQVVHRTQSRFQNVGGEKKKKKRFPASVLAYDDMGDGGFFFLLFLLFRYLSGDSGKREEDGKRVGIKGLKGYTTRVRVDGRRESRLSLGT